MEYQLHSRVIQGIKCVYIDCLALGREIPDSGFNDNSDKYVMYASLTIDDNCYYFYSDSNYDAKCLIRDLFDTNPMLKYVLGILGIKTTTHSHHKTTRERTYNDLHTVVCCRPNELLATASCVKTATNSIDYFAYLLASLMAYNESRVIQNDDIMCCIVIISEMLSDIVQCEVEVEILKVEGILKAVLDSNERPVMTGHPFKQIAFTLL